MLQPNRQNLYLGKAGQFAVMAECLMRGFNVAIPEVDIGDDLFVVNDQSGNYRRIQVKTVTARPRAVGFSAQFQVPLPQLEQVFVPDLVYFLRPAAQPGGLLSSSSPVTRCSPYTNCTAWAPR